MFFEFVAFLGFIELMERKRVEGSIPMAMSNTINTTNPMNRITQYGLKGSLRLNATINAAQSANDSRRRNIARRANDIRRINDARSASIVR